MPNSIYVSRIAPHYWEEPVISGNKGTAAVFFTGCPLDCIYCQNKEISQNNHGRKTTVEEISEEVQLLIDSGCETLSFITPTHYIHRVIDILEYLKPNIPVVYNTGGYESVETLKTLEGYIDVYLPDLKYGSNQLGKLYSGVDDYFDVAKAAIDEMVRQTGKPFINKNGIMEKGVIVRNLLLPNHTRNSIEVIEYLSHQYSDNILFSLMAQYTPYGKALGHEKLGRKITRREYEKVLNIFENSMLEGFSQELTSANQSYIPKWDK